MTWKVSSQVRNPVVSQRVFVTVRIRVDGDDVDREWTGTVDDRTYNLTCRVTFYDCDPVLRLVPIKRRIRRYGREVLRHSEQYVGHVLMMLVVNSFGSMFSIEIGSMSLSQKW